MSTLALIPAAQRRRLAWLLVPLAIVLAVAGLAPLVGSAGALWVVIGVAVLLVAALLALIAAGLLRSAADTEAERAEAELDAQLAGLAACGGDCGSCGVSDCAVRSLPRS